MSELETHGRRPPEHGCACGSGPTNGVLDRAASWCPSPEACAVERAHWPRIAIRDDRLLLGDALRCLLRAISGFRVSGVFTDDDALLAALHADPPDLVLVDADPASVAPFAGLARIRRAGLAVKVVVLVDALEPGAVRAMLDHDPDGVLLRDSTAPTMATSLRQVLTGQSVFPAAWHRAVANGRDDQAADGLSQRQRDVLELLVEGQSYEEIGRRLFISVNTVKFHVRAIYLRLGVRNRLAAARALEAMPPTAHHAG